MQNPNDIDFSQRSGSKNEIEEKSLKENTGEEELLEAAEDGDIEKIKKLLNEQDVDIDCTDSNGDTPLARAVMESHIDIVRILLEYNADINLSEEVGSLVALAACNSDWDIVKLLVSNHADINRMYEGLTALHYAAKKGNAELVEFLLENGADINCQENEKDGPTALHLANKFNKKEVIHVLLKRGAKIRIKDDYHDTVLDYCTEQGLNDRAKRYYQVLKYRMLAMESNLIKRAKMIALPNPSLKELCFFAIKRHEQLINFENKKQKLPKELQLEYEEFSSVDEDIDCTTKEEEDLQYALLEAIDLEQINKMQECVINLLEKGIGMNFRIFYSRKSDSRSPLELAIEKDNPKIVKLLLQAGANVHEYYEGRLPLHWAFDVEPKTPEIMKLLLDAGANINARERNEDGRALLHKIAAEGDDYLDLLSFVLKRNPNLELKDKEGNTALSLAKKYKHKKTLDLLAAELDVATPDSTDENLSDSEEEESSGEFSP